MKFENGKPQDKVSGKLPEWKASDGIYREKIVSRKKKEAGNEETLKGYKPSQEEKKEKKAPRKIMDIENSYGTLSIGVNDKKQMVSLVTQQRTRDLHVMRGQSKTLDSTSAINLQKIPGTARTNSSRKPESAVEYSNDAHRQVPFLLDRMKQFVDRYEFDVQKEIVPFLSLKEEKTRLAALREKRRRLMKTNGSAAEKRAVETEIEYLESMVRDKEQEMQRTRRRLMAIRKDALEQEGEDYASRLLFLWDQLAEEADGSDSAESEEQEDDGEGSK